ncbi:MAG: deoxyribonuclease IV [Limisphaerales bacterium]|jgi:deoxyribonuclease-4
MILGAHMSTAGGLEQAILRGADVGCDCIQMFVKNNMQWFGKPYTREELQAWSNEVASGKVQIIFGHSGYLINLGGPESENRQKSLRSLKQEIELCTQLGLPFLVMHPGSHLKQGEEAGIRQVISGLDEVFSETVSLTRIALEVTAGQGTNLGSKLEHLAAIFDGVKEPSRLGVCLDTAHLFAAGFDIRTPEGWDSVLTSLESLIGLSNLLGIHLNDSKVDLGSRVDRHEHIGKGKIGLEPFRHIVNDPRLKGLPGSLETPKSKDCHEDRENLQILRELIKKN